MMTYVLKKKNLINLPTSANFANTFFFFPHFFFNLGIFCFHFCGHCLFICIPISELKYDVNRWLHPNVEEWMMNDESNDKLEIYIIIKMIQ